jgi:hypothetical protein
MEPTKILPIVAVLSLVSVEYGGWALLTYISGRAGLADWQKGFFRAGHAHAGVLLVLSLVYLLYLPRAEFSDGFEWIAGGVLNSRRARAIGRLATEEHGPVRRQRRGRDGSELFAPRTTAALHCLPPRRREFQVGVARRSHLRRRHRDDAGSPSSRPGL